jgi:hypothetical protein
MLGDEKAVLEILKKHFPDRQQIDPEGLKNIAIEVCNKCSEWE